MDDLQIKTAGNAKNFVFYQIFFYIFSLFAVFTVNKIIFKNLSSVTVVIVN